MPADPSSTSEPLPCVKRPFATEALALAETRKIQATHGHSLRPYRCFCGAWHMTKCRTSRTRRLGHRRET